MSEKVMVTSMSNGKISIFCPDLRLKKDWIKRGQSIPIDKEVLAEAIFDPGVEYMFKKGMLYIENMQDKIDLGLEEPDTKEPTNILPMSESFMKRCLTVMPLVDLRITLSKLTNEQKKDLAAYAVQNELIGDLERADVINKACGVDLYNSLKLKRANEAE